MEYSLEYQDGTAQIQLNGRLTYDANESVSRILKQLDGERTHRVTIDLARVDFVDSAGLGILLLMRDRMKDVPITLRGAQEQVRKIFTLTRLDSMFTIT